MRQWDGTRLCEVLPKTCKRDLGRFVCALALAVMLRPLMSIYGLQGAGSSIGQGFLGTREISIVDANNTWLAEDYDGRILGQKTWLR